MTLPAQQDLTVTTTQPSAPPATTGEQKPAEHMIPKSRMDEVIKERDEARKKADALEKAQQDSERKRLEEANEYKALYEKTQTELSSLKPRADQVEEYEQVLKEQLEAEIATLPEEYQDVIPDGLSTKDQLRWLAKNKSKFMKAEPFDIGAGKTGVKRSTKEPELTPEEKQVAKAFGYSEEDYAKNK